MAFTKLEPTGVNTSASFTFANLTVTGVTTLGPVGNLHISGGSTGQVLATDGAGNLSWVTGGGGGGGSANIYVQSNVNSIVSGSSLVFAVDMSNVTYPGGVFTLNQLGPVSIATTDIWASGSSSKNAYANYEASTVNTQNISITLTLANSTFSVQSSDTITIGSSTITGTDLTGLGITGTGGTYTITNTLFSSSLQTTSSVPVSVNLTTARGQYSSTGTTLVNIQPERFNVTALTGSFASSSVPFWSTSQTFSWSASVTGTVASGNVTYSNSVHGISGSLTSSGATSGTSTSLESTYTYTITSSDYTGAGNYGAGSRVIPTPVTGTISPATKYYPLFWKITNNSSVPSFTTSDSHNSYDFSVGQTAVTSATPSDYLWMATPNSTSHTFKYVFLGTDIVATPDVTSSTTISGQTYSIWGFTNFSVATTLIVTS